jgi:phosphoribosylamine--glycine ligase
MKILVVGSGGREHAIAWKLSQSSTQPTLYFAPGNPGMASLGQRLDIDPLDVQGLLLYAKREGIDLTLVGPEAPLAAGIVDAFEAAGLFIFGPTQAAARMEASKAFAKEIMIEAKVPTARYVHCQTRAEAEAALSTFTPPYVIKQDGLAAGKGVTLAPDLPTAHEALAAAEAAHSPVVIEEFLHGQELSVLAICDGTRAIPLVAAQDHKQIGEGDTGPNTGGMGAYAPVPWVTPALMETVRHRILQPVLETLRAKGILYKGVLYAGLMIAPEGAPSVIEFNARFGDPETQVVLPLLEEDLAEICLASAQGDLIRYEAQGFRQKSGAAITVVLASAGYPGAFEKGRPLTLPDSSPDDVLFFHAGTALSRAHGLVTAGGRVISVTTLGQDLAEAKKNAYQATETVEFEGKYCRRDIADKALGRIDI